VKYTIELEQAGDGGWSGMINEMPGLLLMGKSIDALLASVPEAVSLYLENSGTNIDVTALHPVSIALEVAA
jgi:predicted RNase H-like HicB family nuclease